MLALALGGLLLLLLAFSEYFKVRGINEALASIIALFFGVPALSFAGRLVLREWQQTRARPLPARWRMVLPAKEAGPHLEGFIANDETLLIAPISGRPCVAFEVGLREDDDASAGHGSWILLEQRNAPFSVDGRSIVGDSVHLRLDRQRVQWPSPGPGRLRVEDFLRARGLEMDESLYVFEAVIEAGNRVILIDAAPPTLIDVGAGECSPGGRLTRVRTDANSGPSSTPRSTKPSGFTPPGAQCSIARGA